MKSQQMKLSKVGTRSTDAFPGYSNSGGDS